MISRRSLFGFALVPLAASSGADLARAKAYGEALAVRTDDLIGPVPTLGQWLDIQRASTASAAWRNVVRWRIKVCGFSKH